MISLCVDNEPSYSRVAEELGINNLDSVKVRRHNKEMHAAETTPAVGGGVVPGLYFVLSRNKVCLNR